LKFGFTRSLIFLLCCVFVSGCSMQRTTAGSKDELIIFAAASIAPVLQEINKQFEAENAVSITLNKAGTQELKAQIEQGAKADLLISAREKDVKSLEEKGLVEHAEKLASNELVFIVSPEGAKKISAIEDIAKDGIRLVIAEENAPVGEYSRKLIRNLDESRRYGSGFYEQVIGNVVSNESNEQHVLSKVLLGEADAGIVYRSSLSSVKDSEKKITPLEVDKELNVQSYYYLVKLKGLSSVSEDYMKWLKSEKSKELMRKFGFSDI
jgi:molybdate transport system substrate-binding protein